MMRYLATLLNHPDRYLPILNRFQAILITMDRQYRSAAAAYGFECKGCSDNCCLTLFYHHTLVECLYLHTGFQKLGRDMRRTIKRQAMEADNHHKTVAGTGRSTRQMCPLNLDNRCLLYEHRPMICRLHGIPYELHATGRDILRGPGCGAFDRDVGTKPYVTFDRTPVYAAVAELEEDLRRAVHFTQRIRLSIAQIFLAHEYTTSPTGDGAG